MLSKNNMDIIFIEQLTVMSFIGVHAWEQQCLQKLIFDLELGWKNELKTYNNEINYINYIDISEAVITLVNKNNFLLIEEVAEKVAQNLINKFNLIWVRIKVSKPGAIPYANNVGVVIERSK